MTTGKGILSAFSHLEALVKITWLDIREQIAHEPGYDKGELFSHAIDYKDVIKMFFFSHGK